MLDTTCRKLDIRQIFSRPHTPKDNPALERFNRTLQDEWLSMSETGLDDINQANVDLTEWLVEYNFNRPHHSLDLKSPIMYAQEKYKVSPVWSASTMVWENRNSEIWQELWNLESTQIF